MSLEVKSDYNQLIFFNSLFYLLCLFTIVMNIGIAVDILNILNRLNMSFELNDGCLFFLIYNYFPISMMAELILEANSISYELYNMGCSDLLVAKQRYIILSMSKLAASQFSNFLIISKSCSSFITMFIEDITIISDFEDKIQNDVVQYFKPRFLCLEIIEEELIP